MGMTLLLVKRKELGAEMRVWLEEEEAMRRAGDHGHRPLAALAQQRVLRPRQLRRLPRGEASRLTPRPTALATE